MARIRSTRRLQFEGLEARQLMAADLYLDFGFAFDYDADQQAAVFDVDVSDPAANAPPQDWLPTEMKSLTDSMIDHNVDYDQDGFVNVLDARALAQEVVDIVKRIYEPFAVNVQLADAETMADAIDTLDTHSTKDSYIFVTGNTVGGYWGVAMIDQTNANDNVGFAFADSLIGREDGPPAYGDHQWEWLALSIAQTAAHEASHNFGLLDLLSSSEGLPSEQLRLAGTELSFNQTSGHHMPFAMRWDGLPLAVSTQNSDEVLATQNSYEVLAENIGLKPNAPAYVTGTGADDIILIEGLGNNQARVTISAFWSRQHVGLIETQSYEIDVTYGVMVEGGYGRDHIEVVNLSVPATLRGGQEDDVLIGSNGDDTFEGDNGSDTMSGGAGSDTYVFRGPRHLDLDKDTIDDTSGADDALDFSQLHYAINVNLAATANQQIDIHPTQTFFMNGQYIEVPTLGFRSRLNLDLTPGTGSTGIENVRGTRFADRIYGNELDNSLFGLEGADWLYGYMGNDDLFGGHGNDILRGGDGRDKLFGEMGRDKLFGERGSDYLHGGLDGLRDHLNGGEDADEFVQFYRYDWAYFSTPPYVRRTYTLVEGEELADFNSSLGDTIAIVVVA